MAHPLDDPVRSALTGPHAHLAQWRGRVVRYPPQVLRFVAIPHPATAADWADAAALAGPEQAPAVGIVVDPPAEGWNLAFVGPGLQYVNDDLAATDLGPDEPPDGETVRLGPADVPEITAFVARNRDGRRFPPRTMETGVYLGVRRGGALVAMAGERLRPVGWTELTAVCTDAAHRRQGLARWLVRALLAGIAARGESAFLHVAHDNTGALALYEGFGFRLRRPISMALVHLPQDGG